MAPTHSAILVAEHITFQTFDHTTHIITRTRIITGSTMADEGAIKRQRQRPSWGAQLEQRWTDLNLLCEIENNRNKELHESFERQLEILRTYLGDGARAVAEHPEHRDALTLLLASEIWMKEGDLNFELGTPFEVFDFLSKEDFDQAVDVLPHGLCLEERTKLVMKARNLQEAALSVLRRDSNNLGINTELSFQFIHSIHCIVVKDLGISSEIRTVRLAPAHQPHMYVLPDKVMRRLATLMAFVNEKMAEVKVLDDQNARLKKSIALAALFFCEFLKIHPFRNGNGRTARLLLSWLLRDETAVPVSLTTSREEYMNAVADGQWYGRPPFMFTALVAKCAAISAWNALDLFGEDD
jgi:hypothetical protein